MRCASARVSQLFFMTKTLRLSDYSQDWPQQFRVLRAELHTRIPTCVLEHIGSTAVPGLCAKPIIDILVGAYSLKTIEQSIPAITQLGYVYKPEHESVLPERRYFSRALSDGESSCNAVHVHAVVHGESFWLRHIAFRDALRGDAALAHAYATLKRTLATEHVDDRAAYTDAKAPFIEAVLWNLAKV